MLSRVYRLFLFERQWVIWDERTGQILFSHPIRGQTVVHGREIASLNAPSVLKIHNDSYDVDSEIHFHL